jgi:hypothetical protein
MSILELQEQGQIRRCGGKSITHHHPCSALQTTDGWQVCRDTTIIVMDWAMAVYRDTGVMEITSTMGSIFLRDPRVVSNHSILSYYYKTRSSSPNI